MGKMHEPYSRFKGWLRENNLTYTDVANVLGVTAATISSKINGHSDFSLSEVNELRRTYHLESNIFFTNYVA